MLLHEIYNDALRKSPDKKAIILNDGTSCTYKVLHDVSNRWAQALLWAGVKKGDPVTILIKNSVEYFYLYFACYRIGAIASPMSTMYQSLKDEVAFAMNLTKSRFLLTSSDYYTNLKDIKQLAPLLEKIFIIDSNEDSELSWEDIVKNAPGNLAWPDIKESDTAIIIFTSGSTDRPKGVTHTHLTITKSVDNYRTDMRFDDKAVHLVATMMCHGSGGLGISLPTLNTGGTLIFLRDYSTPVFLKLVQKYHPTHVMTTPVDVVEILSCPDSKNTDFSSIKSFKCGGDSVPPDVFEAFYKLAGYELNNGYGTTEFVEACANPPYGKIKRCSIGLPAHNTKIRLIDAGGKDVLRGQTGELLVQSDSLFTGYWGDPVNTKKAFIDGWMRTGDLAYQDEDGYYFFAGRKKNIIVKSGANIAPAEIEDVLNMYPGIKMSGVAGVPDEHFGNILKAFVVLDKESKAPAPGEKELKDYVGKKLSAIKVPDQWKFVDSLPTTSIGKINRKALAELVRR